MAFGKTGIDWRSTKAAVWRSNRHFLKPVTQPDVVDPESLSGIDEQKSLLYKNTENFLRNQPCCHALLWGARGVGKSSLIKTLLTRYHRVGLRLIQLPKSDLHLLPDITDDISDYGQHFIIYCDDLSFDEDLGEYQMLKNTIVGSLEKPPSNVLIYVTSNRRHLMPEYLADNFNVHSEANDTQPEAVAPFDERLSLIDRFGLSLSFPPMTEEIYLTIVDNLFRSVRVDKQQLHEEAKRFAQQRGGHSGQTARHFFNHYHIYL